MKTVLSFLLVNVVLGAWDTIWYHELKAKLPYHLSSTRPELRLHAIRDAIYAVLYGLLAWLSPSGWWVAFVSVLIITEIAITLCDFVVEDRDRAAIGGLAPGERILHTLMAIVYGAMLCRLIPLLVENAGLENGFRGERNSELLQLGCNCSGRGHRPEWNPRRACFARFRPTGADSPAPKKFVHSGVRNWQSKTRHRLWPAQPPLAFTHDSSCPCCRRLVRFC